MFRALTCPLSGARDYNVLLPHMVCNTLVVGGRLLGEEQQAIHRG